MFPNSVRVEKELSSDIGLQQEVLCENGNVLEE